MRAGRQATAEPDGDGGGRHHVAQKRPGRGDLHVRRAPDRLQLLRRDAAEKAGGERLLYQPLVALQRLERAAWAHEDVVGRAEVLGDLAADLEPRGGRDASQDGERRGGDGDAGHQRQRPAPAVAQLGGDQAQHPATFAEPRAERKGEVTEQVLFATAHERLPRLAG